MYKSIYLNLKEIRLKKKLSVYRVAKDLGVEITTITNHEQNKVKYIKIDFLLQLCNYYKVGLTTVLKTEKEG